MLLFSRHRGDAVVWSLGNIYFCVPLCQAHQQEEEKEKEIQMQNITNSDISVVREPLDNPGPDPHLCECTTSSSHLWCNDNTFLVVGSESNQV